MVQNIYLKVGSCSTGQEVLFTPPEGPLPCLQKTDTGLCPKTVEFSVHPHVSFIKIRFNNLIILKKKKPCLPNGLFLSDFQTKIPHAIFTSHVCYMFHPSHHPLFNINNSIKQKVQILHFVIFSTTLLLPFLKSEYFPRHSEHPLFFP
jgi:hypothetical protein